MVAKDENNSYSLTILKSITLISIRNHQFIMNFGDFVLVGQSSFNFITLFITLFYVGNTVYRMIANSKEISHNLTTLRGRI